MNRAASASRPSGFDPHSRRAIARILPVARGLRPWRAQGIQTLRAASTRIPLRGSLVRTLGARVRSLLALAYCLLATRAGVQQLLHPESREAKMKLLTTNC